MCQVCLAYLFVCYLMGSFPGVLVENERDACDATCSTFYFPAVVKVCFISCVAFYKNFKFSGKVDETI